MQANQWLRRFRIDITSNSNRLYANGRQQVKVSITLEAREGQTISSASLNSLRLFVLDDDGAVIDLTHTDTANTGLKAATRRDERFEYHAHHPQIHTRSLSRSLSSSLKVLRRHFYVSSTLPGGTLSTLHARIQKDDDTWFDTLVAPFVSSVEIESISPLRLDETHFELDREDAHDHENYDLDLWYLRFINPNFRIVANRSLKCPGGRHFSIQSTGYTSTTTVGQIHYISKIHTLHAFDIGKPPHWYSLDRKFHIALNAKPGAMTLLYARLTVRQRLVIDKRYESVWAVIDQHGNEHTVKFRPMDGGKRIGFTTNF
ncbi:hypothetical protein DQ397_004461 [Pseudomonas sp. CK-NBRI-02]|uniref:hypothetical protein n=1 Tax=Pseudomonas sp. CK-NBRI-02 TaxID=2249759 RepID=UPI0011E6D212|nr:hypothetical protein [Pseudomonas sp. CK-NBRI-02]TYO70198.1 hypothetical protein DQ397_004461 [Pseudomonas sp. CK-NBRI-02]